MLTIVTLTICIAGVADITIVAVHLTFRNNLRIEESTSRGAAQATSASPRDERDAAPRPRGVSEAAAAVPMRG